MTPWFHYKKRDPAILKAHDTGRYSYAEIGEYFKVHFTTVGRIVRSGKQARRQAAKKATRYSSR